MTAIFTTAVPWRRMSRTRSARSAGTPSKSWLDSTTRARASAGQLLERRGRLPFEVDVVGAEAEGPGQDGQALGLAPLEPAAFPGGPAGGDDRPAAAGQARRRRRADPAGRDAAPPGRPARRPVGAASRPGTRRRWLRRCRSGMSFRRPYAKKPLQPVRLKGLELSGVPRRPLSLDGPLDLMDVIPPEPEPNGIAGPNDTPAPATAAEAAGVAPGTCNRSMAGDDNRESGTRSTRFGGIPARSAIL